MVAPIKPDRAIRDQLAAKHYPHIMPLEDFPEPFLGRIMAEVEQDERPHRYRYFGTPGDPRPMARIDSRGWLEWHLHRGQDPHRRGGIPPEIRRAVINRDGHVCGICGSAVEPTDVHLDHVIPYSRGGPTTAENLRVTHSKCNLQRGNRVDGA
jgi:hypothetical protein